MDEELAAGNRVETSVVCGSVVSSETFALPPPAVTEKVVQMDEPSSPGQKGRIEMKQDGTLKSLENDYGRASPEVTMEPLENDNGRAFPEVVLTTGVEEEERIPLVAQSKEEDGTEHLAAEKLGENIAVYVDDVGHNDDMPVTLSDSEDLVLIKEGVAEYFGNSPTKLAEKECEELSCKSDVEAISGASGDEKLNREEDFTAPSFSEAIFLVPSPRDVLEALDCGAKMSGILDTTNQMPTRDLLDTEEVPRSDALQAVGVDEWMDVVVVRGDGLQDAEAEKEKVELGSLGKEASAIRSGRALTTPPLPSFGKNSITIAKNMKLELLTREDLMAMSMRQLKKRFAMLNREDLMAMSMRQLKKQFAKLNRKGFTAPSFSAATIPSPRAISKVLEVRDFGAKTFGIASSSTPDTNQVLIQDHPHTEKVPVSLAKEASASRSAPALATPSLSSSGKNSMAVTAKNTKPFTDDKENSVVLLFANTTDNSLAANNAGAIREDGLPDKQRLQGKKKKRKLELPTQEDLMAMSMRQLKKHVAALSFSGKQNVSPAVDAGHEVV